jgi:hypothetical protein
VERTEPTSCLISSADGYDLWVSLDQAGRCSCTLGQKLLLTWNEGVEPLSAACDQKQEEVAGRWVQVDNSGLEVGMRTLDPSILVVVRSWIRGCDH